jgi:hypothetical protein
MRDEGGGKRVLAIASMLFIGVHRRLRKRFSA